MTLALCKATKHLNVVHMSCSETPSDSYFVYTNGQWWLTSLEGASADQ